MARGLHRDLVMPHLHQLILSFAFLTYLVGWLVWFFLGEGGGSQEQSEADLWKTITVNAVNRTYCYISVLQISVELRNGGS